MEAAGAGEATQEEEEEAQTGGEREGEEEGEREELEVKIYTRFPPKTRGEIPAKNQR